MKFHFFPERLQIGHHRPILRDGAVVVVGGGHFVTTLLLPPGQFWGSHANRELRRWRRRRRRSGIPFWSEERGGGGRLGGSQFLSAAAKIGLPCSSSSSKVDDDRSFFPLFPDLLNPLPNSSAGLVSHPVKKEVGKEEGGVKHLFKNSCECRIFFP